MKSRLNFEELESRDTPSVVINQGEDLYVYGDVSTPNVISVENVGAQVKVNVNGQSSVFDEPNHVFLIGGDQRDFLTNFSRVAASVYGLEGNDVVRGFSGKDFFVPGTGLDEVQALAGKNYIYTNEDADVDSIAASQDSFVSAGANDVVLRNLPPFLSHDILYLFSSNTGDSFVALDYGTRTLVVQGNGNLVIANNDDFSKIFFVGHDGNDIFLNGSSKDALAFGGGGLDLTFNVIANDAIEFTI